MELKAKVAERLATAGATVKDAVVDHLYKEELDRRTNAALKAVSKLEDLEKQLRKANKPDQVQYDGEGKEVSSSYSKAVVDELKKLREEKAKYEGALNKALEENDFSKLLELAK